MSGDQPISSEWRSASFVTGCILIFLGCGLGFLIDPTSQTSVDSILGVQRKQLTWLVVGLIISGFAIAVFAPRKRR